MSWKSWVGLKSISICHALGRVATEEVEAKRYWLGGWSRWAGRTKSPGKSNSYTLVVVLNSLLFYRLLDVGAVRPDNYRACESWIDVTPIDLHSRHPSILEQDCLRMDQGLHREAWDIISLSLVLNFVPDGKDRGTLATSRLQQPTAHWCGNDVVQYQGGCSSRRTRWFAQVVCVFLLCVLLAPTNVSSHHCWPVAKNSS